MLQKHRKPAAAAVLACSRYFFEPATLFATPATNAKKIALRIAHSIESATFIAFKTLHFDPTLLPAQFAGHRARSNARHAQPIYQHHAAAAVASAQRNGARLLPQLQRHGTATQARAQRARHSAAARQDQARSKIRYPHKNTDHSHN